MAKIQIRRGAAAEWTAANPVLAIGEPGLETDTKKRKTGDGVTPWISLGYDGAEKADVGLMRAAPQLRGKGVICFTWDDNFSDWLSEVMAPARALGQRHTFNIQTGTIDQAGHLTAAQIAAAAADGHEIASHSVSHADMTTLTTAQQIAEYDNSKAALEAIVGVGNVTTFAYPYGAGNGTTGSMAYGRYDRLLYASGQFLYRPEDYNNVGKVGRLSWSDTTTARVQAFIRLAATQPVRLVIMCHDPGAPGYPTVAEVAQTLQLAHDLDVPCVPLREAFPSWYLLPNPGFENGLGGWETALTGTGTAAAVTDTPDVGLAGTKSAKLTTADVTSSAAVSTVAVVRVTGETWSVQCRARATVRTAGAGGVFIEIEERSADGSIVATSTSTAITSPTWVKTTKTFTPNAKTVWVYVRCRVTNQDADAYFDHINLAPAIDAFG